MRKVKNQKGLCFNKFDMFPDGWILGVSSSSSESKHQLLRQSFGVGKLGVRVDSDRRFLKLTSLFECRRSPRCNRGDRPTFKVDMHLMGQLGQDSIEHSFT